MPWWVVAYFIVFSLFAAVAMGDELRKGNVFQAVVEAVPFCSSFSGGIAYWIGDAPSRPLSVMMGVMLALGVPLLIADTVVGERDAREEHPEDSPAMSVFTWLVVCGMFLPAYVWACLHVARAWT